MTVRKMVEVVEAKSLKSNLSKAKEEQHSASGDDEEEDWDEVTSRGNSCCLQPSIGFEIFSDGWNRL